MLSKRQLQHLQRNRNYFISHLKQGPLAWWIVITLVLLYFIPYFQVGANNITLAGYLGLSAIPVITAALLRSRTGAFIAFFLLCCGFTIDNIYVVGLHWSKALFLSWSLGVFSLFLVALAAGQFCYLRNRLKYVNTQLEREHQELEMALAALKKQALMDAVTNLPNHRAIIEQLEKEFERTSRSDHPLSLLFFDADYFKQINDTYGHAVGDSVLYELGERAKNVLRAGDTLGRFGGEEFVILLPETSSRQAYVIAERIRSVIASHPLATSVLEGGVKATISIGVACYPEDCSNQNDLLEKADQAMYRSKKLGRNQVHTASETQYAA